MVPGILLIFSRSPYSQCSKPKYSFLAGGLVLAEGLLAGVWLAEGLLAGVWLAEGLLARGLIAGLLGPGAKVQGRPRGLFRQVSTKMHFLTLFLVLQVCLGIRVE
jgi:hypothetical protein